jgi:hypothetical protein
MSVEDRRKAVIEFPAVIDERWMDVADRSAEAVRGSRQPGGAAVDGGCRVGDQARRRTAVSVTIGP